MTADVMRKNSGNALHALGAQARRASSSRLVGVEALGLAVTLAIWIWFPERIPVALPFLALSAVGLWGMTDRVIVAGRRTLPLSLRTLLRGVRWIIAVAGVVAAMAAIYLVVGSIIGTVLS